MCAYGPAADLACDDFFFSEIHVCVVVNHRHVIGEPAWELPQNWLDYEKAILANRTLRAKLTLNP